MEFQADIYNRLNELLSDLSIEHQTLPAPSTELRKEWSDLIVRETLEALGRARASARSRDSPAVRSRKDKARSRR